MIIRSMLINFQAVDFLSQTDDSLYIKGLLNDKGENNLVSLKEIIPDKVANTYEIIAIDN